jgi:hypothetical protein
MDEKAILAAAAKVQEVEKRCDAAGEAQRSAREKSRAADEAYAAACKEFREAKSELMLLVAKPERGFLV